MTVRCRHLLWAALLATLAACASERSRPAPAPDPAPPVREIYRAPTVRPNIPDAGPNFGDVVDESVRRRRVLEQLDAIHGRREF